MAHQNRYTGLKRDDHQSNSVIREYGVEMIPMDEHSSADLRKYIDHVYDQGELYSCTANVVCSAFELLLKRGADLAKLPASNFKCSRLFVYYNSRDNTDEDTGTSLYSAFKAINDDGVCRESLWPYDVLKFAQKPSSASYAGAKGNSILRFESLGPHLQQFRACLKDGFPFAFGFKVYNSFRSLESDNTGMMPMPSKEEVESDPEPEMQAALAVGYDDKTKRITVLNSWGESFGDKGYFYMPYDYISDPTRAFDFWTIVEVSENVPSPKSQVRPPPQVGPSHAIWINWYTRQT